MLGFAAAVSSPALLLLLCWWAWGAVFRNDWGPGSVLKVLMVVGFTWVAVGVGAVGSISGKRCNWAALATGGLSILFSVTTGAPDFLKHAGGMPGNDIGRTTLDCARLFWTGEGNPYTSESVNPRPGLPDGYRGFHYGPGMLLCYAGGAFGQGGYQVFHFVWVTWMVLAGALLSGAGGGGTVGRVAAGIFFAAVLLSSPGWWKEYFHMGVNDAAPLALMAGSLLLAGQGRWTWGGVLAGLAFSAKFSPGGFLLLAMLRRGTPVQFWWGSAAGAAPLWLAMAVEPEGGFRNIFLSRLYVEGTPTGLYHLFPGDFQELLPLIALAGTCLVVFRGWGYGHEPASILRTLVILACIGVLGHKETHANHLTWILFFGGILLAAGRGNLWKWLAGTGAMTHDPRGGKETMNGSIGSLSNPVRPPLPIGK